uniref:Protein F37C4.5 n=1 Tax=Panagrolaimus superbus TaxID=310955 RepID=A0A914Z259_9BILA
MATERSVQIVNAREIPIKSVIVFTDRAEITRNFKVNLKSGINEIHLKNVASSIVPNSISVDGKGNATILEVKFEAKPSNPSKDDLDKIKKLKEELKEVQSKFEAEKELNGVINSKLSALNNLLNKFTEKSEKKDESVIIFNETTETSMENLFDFYEKKVLDFNKRLKEVKERGQLYEEEIQRLQNEINQHTWNNKVKNIICIEIEREHSTEDQGEEDELTLIYQVYGASWSPSYDLRVKSKLNQPEIILSYYANIQQQTGEEWENVELSLSTAQPSLGNALPKLGSTVVQFFRPPVIQPLQMLRRGGGGGGVFGTASKCMSFGAAPEEAVPQMKQSTSVAEENVLSTTFNIPQKKTISSDPSKHKVKIMGKTLIAYLHYECVPKKDTKVYLMATVINSSDYPFLPGPANVYIDNSLSTTLHLNAVSPGEKFDCSLGVDKAIKVIYKPIQKFHSQSGVFTSVASSGNEQQIIVKNTKRTESIKITLHEPIPKSSEEKIKVRILAPETIKSNTASKDSKDNTHAIPLPTVGVIFDDLQNLVWTETIQPESEKQFVIKWAIDYPPNEKLEYVESWPQE